MATFGGFDLQTAVFVTTEISYRSYAAINDNTAKVPRRAGSKLLGREFGPKQIRLSGYVIGSSASDLLSQLDSLQKNLNTAQSQELKPLVIDTNRTYQAYVSNLAVPTNFYNQSYVPWEATFVAPDPFAYGPVNTIQGTVASGTSNGNFTITVSGTVFVEPKLTINWAGAAAGNTTVSGIVLQHLTRGTSITVSGIMPFSSDFITSWSGVQVTVSGVNRNFAGQLDRWEPGANNLRMTVTSGTNPGFNYTFAWQERYI